MILKGELKLYLQKKFQIKNLGQLWYFLGIKEAGSEKKIFLSQWKYVLDILLEVDMLGCKPVNSPMDTNSKLLPDQESF